MIPPAWHGWMHHTVDVPPTEDNIKPHPWEKPHRPNLTGTPVRIVRAGRPWRKGVGRRPPATTRPGRPPDRCDCGRLGSTTRLRLFRAAFRVLTGRSAGMRRPHRVRLHASYCPIGRARRDAHRRLRPRAAEFVFWFWRGAAEAAGCRAQRNGSASAAATTIASATISRPDDGNLLAQDQALRDPGAALPPPPGGAPLPPGAQRARVAPPTPDAGVPAPAPPDARPHQRQLRSLTTRLITEVPTQKIEVRGHIAGPRKDHGPDHFLTKSGSVDTLGSVTYC